jgi:hypothetical protein
MYRHRLYVYADLISGPHDVMRSALITARVPRVQHTRDHAVNREPFVLASERPANSFDLETGRYNFVVFKNLDMCLCPCVQALRGQSPTGTTQLR